MKPINFEKKAAQNIARARMLIKAHLAWLNGYPSYKADGLIWINTATKESFKVDAKSISKAQRTVNTLYREFPVALPAVVGDAKVWYKRCCEYIDYAKQMVNSDTQKIISLFDLNDKYKQSLKTKLSSHSPPEVVAQLSWKFFINRTGINKSLSFFNEFPHFSNEIKNSDLINLVSIYCEETVKSKSFINFALVSLTSNNSYHVNEHRFKRYLNKITEKNIKRWQEKFKAIDYPKVNNRKIVLLSMEKLSTLKAPQRRKLFELFDILSLDSIVKQWQSWWPLTEHFCKKIENHVTLSSKVNIDEIENLQAQLHQHLQSMPVSLNLNEFLDALHYFSNDKTVTAALNKLIKTFKKDEHRNHLIAPLLNFLQPLHDWLKPKNPKFLAYLVGLTKFISIANVKGDSFPWSEVPEYPWSSFETDLFEKANKSQISHFFEVLISISHHSKVSLKRHHLSTILNAVLAGLDIYEIIDILLELDSNEYKEELPVSVVTIYKHLGLASSDIPRLIKIQETLFNEDTWTDEFESLFKVFKELNYTELLRKILQVYDDKNLLRINYLIKVVKKNSGIEAIPKVKETNSKYDSWISDYPEVFHIPLQHLNTLSSKAAHLTHAIFKKVWWTNAMIQSEINQLNALGQSPTGNIEKRLLNLKKQVDNHQPVTAKQTQKITQKLFQKINQLELTTWLQNLEIQFKSDWCAFFKVDADKIPPWLIDSDTVGKLCYILDLERHTKALAKEVIKQRIKGKYFYLENKKQNKTFLKALNEEGINISHWFDHPESYHYQAKNDENITIEFEADPLEVLDMGAHFSTCLSPGGMNYFSVFPNIADINKAVIYARNEERKVIGRVLIGITAQGGLQVFHTYTHHKDYEFEKHVQLFIKELAARTNLTLTQTGKVLPLCTTEWYDDGAKDINHEIACFRDKSKFRQQLASMSSSELESKLIQALAPRKLNSITFSLLIKLPETRSNHELYPILNKLSTTIPNLYNSDLIEFYELACEYGKGADCFATHQKRFMKYFLKRIKDQWLEYEEVELIAKHHPSEALKIIKADAKSRKTHWKKQPVYEAIKATSIALEKLERPKLAKSISSSKRFI